MGEAGDAVVGSSRAGGLHTGPAVQGLNLAFLWLCYPADASAGSGYAGRWGKPPEDTAAWL